jgi:hypothetical protein
MARSFSGTSDTKDKERESGIESSADGGGSGVSRRRLTHPFIMGAWKKDPLTALVVCPAFRGRTEVQIP